MHVLFVTGEYPPMQGGVGAYTHELACALHALDIRASVLTSERAGITAGETGRSEDVSVLPVIRHWDWSCWSTVAKYAVQLQAGWIHVQYQTAAFGMHPAINFAPRHWRRQGHQVAWTYHDLLVPYLFPKAGRGLRTWVTERPAHLADLTIVTNEGDRLQLARAGVAAVRIPIGSNIEGIKLGPVERTARRRARGYGDGDLVLAYFGFLNRSKGGLTLVRTLDQLVRTRPNVYLLMLGERMGASDPANYAYLQEVEALLDNLGLASHVQWIGRQPEAEVAADLNAIDVLLMPYVDGASLRRGTLMAGLANGCAIVTTAPQTPLPELQDGHDLLYVPAEDAAALAAAVLRLDGDRALAANLRTNARVASERFAWPRIAQIHAECYRYKPRKPV